ncbi:MAG: HNH endonuclease signature motif containing protein [Pirellulales bacterium]
MYDRARKARFDKENKEVIRMKNARLYAQNRDARRAAVRAWQRANPAKVNAYARGRDAAQLSATPQWLTAIQQAQIQEFYEVAVARAVQTGLPHHVDHIHPLKGKTFRGLHVPWNLQVLTGAENQTKGNRLPHEEI